MTLADTLAQAAENPLVIRCSNCRWSFACTIGTLKKGSAAYVEHRRVKHAHHTSAQRPRRHTDPRRPHVNGKHIDANVRAARQNGAGKHVFDYMCEKCLDTTQMTTAQFRRLYPKGRFVCDECAPSPKGAS